MDKKRFFSFGCSFTKSWETPTWVDYIGVNYEEFYNLAMPGSANNLIMQRFVEADSFYKFNKDTDTIMIGISGLGRHSFPVTIDGKDFFYSRGDLDVHQSSDKDTEDIKEKFQFVRDKLWKRRYSVFDSFIATKVMKDILTSKNIEHKIISALDYKMYLENSDVYGIDEELHSKIELIQEMLDVKESISEYDNYSVHHPSQETHYNFVKTYFPEFLTDKSSELLNRGYNDRYFDYIKSIYPNYSGLGSYNEIKRKHYCFGYI